ncbi:hypothetical protein AAG906_038906 [Vitis piasezkii]
MALTPLPYFADLVSKVESFELFQRSFKSSDSTTATFTTANRRCTTSHGTPSASHCNQQGRSHSHDNNSSNQGQTHFGQGRRPPRCQICHMRAIMLIATTNVFNTSCSLSRPEAADWFLDTKDLTHMTTDPSILDQSKNYTNKNSVIIGNDVSLPITHIESSNRKDGGDR